MDAYRLEEAVASASHMDDVPARLALLAEALSAWRGPAAPELADEEFAQADIHRFSELRLAALEQRVDALLLLEGHVEAAVELQRLVAAYPLRERFQAQLMTALYRSGRQAEALAVYERARRTLVEELGLDPGPELQGIAQAVLQHSPTLRAPKVMERPAAPGPGDRDRPAGPGRVPRPLDPLIGREDEVERLSARLTSRRLVTLTGPGGAGKTRLAAEVSARLAWSAWWVDLSAAESGDSVLAAVARGTDVATRGEDARSALVSQLAQRDGLLVLDTCERARAEVRGLVEVVLRGCPRVRILTTSRQPLGAATELVWPVPPLSLPDPDAASPKEVGRAAAVRLFLDRAANRRPGFELTSANCVDVARICLLLDGLPLAIELAAAHAGMLEPRTMVRVLDDRLRLLVDEARGERQHTLRATIGWSYELLSEDEAVFFARLSVFAGAFPIQAAEAVAGAGLRRDALELLLAVAGQSLVVAAGGDRFRMLDTIRAFAAERLAEHEDEAETHRRHAGWYADVLGESGPPGRRTQVEGWRGDLRDALSDIRRALEWCFTGGDDEMGTRLLSSLWWLWPREGVFEEAAAWFPRAKALVPEGSALQADLLASSGTYAVSRGELETAVRECGTAVELYDHQGRRRSGAHALLGLGVAYWGLGDYERAADAHERAADAYAEMGDTWGIGICLALRARTAIDAGDRDVVARLDAAEAAAVRSGDDHALAVVLMQRGRAEVAAGDAAAAERHAAESLRRNEQHGHREGVLGSLHVLGFARLSQGDVRSARTHFTRALRSAVAMHHAGACAESLDGLGLVASCQERLADAAALFAAADDVRARGRIRRTLLTGRLVESARAHVTEALDRTGLAQAERRATGLELPHLLELAMQAEQPA